MTSSKQRLRLAHQLLDRELENSSVSKRSTENPDSSKFWSFQVKKQSTGKSDINELQKKLMDLQRKMENISCSSDPDDTDIFVKKLSKDKDSQSLDKKGILIKKNHNSYEEDEDSEDDNVIYQKIQKKAQKVSHSKPAPSPYKLKQSKGSLRESVKSVKSKKSTISAKNPVKLNRSHSKSSIGSRRSMVSNRSDLKQYEIENAKENRKILNLEKEVLHYKRLCEKQKQKLEQYRVMEIEYKKLQNNFSKSEKVRKQQKKIIDSLRSRP